MARGDQLGRQWKIIQTLITLKKGKSAAELATDLDIHPRTVYRVDKVGTEWGQNACPKTKWVALYHATH